MRPARALIDLAALRANYRLARELAGGRALAVVKADAYGHGAVTCATALDGEADGFAVACIEEALELREAGIRSPVLLLEGVFQADELAMAARHGLWVAVHSLWQVELIERAGLSAPLRVWLKADTGMHRLGMSADAVRAAADRLRAVPGVEVAVLMSHLASADELEADATREQLAAFAQLREGLGLETSLANSAGLLGWPQARGGWGRPGLMLYGASPFPGPHPLADRLQPVMRLQSRIIAVNELVAGDRLGYGGRFTAQGPMRIGVVAMGYADGYPQAAADGTPVMIDGRPGRLVGRVSMDMLTIDLDGHPQAGVGTPVELWGAQVPVTSVAHTGGTSAYRLLSGLKRVPRIAVDGAAGS